MIGVAWAARLSTVRPGRELAAAERSSSECVTGLVAEPGQWRASEAVTVAGNVDASRRASVNDAGAADSGPGPTMPPQASRPHHAEIRASPLLVREARVLRFGRL
jgi:hypothetical protein